MTWRRFHLARFVRRLLFGPGKPVNLWRYAGSFVDAEPDAAGFARYSLTADGKPWTWDVLREAITAHCIRTGTRPPIDVPSAPLPLDLRCLLWEARKDVDSYVIDRRRARYHRGERDLAIVPPFRLDGEFYRVNGRATRMFVDVRARPPKRVKHALCGGTGLMRRWLGPTDDGSPEWQDEACEDCSGSGWVDEHAGTGEHLGADVLAFSPGHGDGLWWAEFRVRGLPAARYGHAVTGAKISDVIQRALDLEGMEIAS